MIITDSKERGVVALESSVDGSDGVLIIVAPRYAPTQSIQITVSEIARIMRHFDKRRGAEESKETI